MIFYVIQICIYRVMDRSWMTKSKVDNVYKDGVEQFLGFAYQNLAQESEILCPCKKCKNRKHKSCDEVRTHLRCDGILQGYTTWVHHGEDYGGPPIGIIDMSTSISANLPSSDAVHVGQDAQPGMQELLQAAFGRAARMSHDQATDFDTTTFPDTEHNISQDDNRNEGDALKRKHNVYGSFLKDAHTPLYPGCQFSRLSFVVTLYHFKCLHGWSQESFTSLLGFLSAALPPEANLPKTYYEARKIIRELGLDYKKIHACPKDCILFRGEHAKKDVCPVCESSRWKKDDEKKTSSGKAKVKRIAAKVLHYFPLIPRIQRLFSTSKTSDDMRWHEEARTIDGKLRHPADGEAWKDFNDRYEDFAKDARNVRLGLASDGFNPFGHKNVTHSTWPVMLVPYNLPPWICMKQSSLMLSMIIPGPESPGNDVDVYLEPLIDELLELWGGVETFDASSEKEFSLRAALLWTINDFPALAYLYGWSTSGTFACPSCGPATKSLYLNKGRKMCFMGHRRWLPPNHSYRTQRMQFDGTVETALAPEKMSGSTVLRMLEGKVFVSGKGKNDDTGKKKGNKKRKRKGSGSKKQEQEGEQKIPDQKRKRNSAAKKNGGGEKPEKKPEDWLKKQSIFFKLPYWEKNKLRHNIDVMHLEKNVCDNFIGTLLAILRKSKDGLKARQDLVELGIRKDLQPIVDAKGKEIAPDAPFTMSKEQKNTLCSILQKLRTPDGYASNISRCVNMQECTLSGLKSHDNHVLLHDILPAALRSCYPSKDVMKIVVGLSTFFKKLCSKVIDVAELDNLQESIVMTLCDMERIFLPSFFTVSVHLMVHLVDEVKLGGPVQFRWMYPIERYIFLFLHFSSYLHYII